MNKVTTSYVHQEQRPGGWEDNLGRYKAFARERGTRPIERTDRVLAEGPPKKGY